MLLYFVFLSFFLSFFLSYSLTPWSRVLLDKLIGSQLVKKFPACYRTRRFITAVTNVGHLSLSRARPIQSMPSSNFLKIKPNIFIPSRPGSSMWPLSLIFAHQKHVCTSPRPNMCYIPPPPSQSSRFDHPNIIC